MGSHFEAWRHDWRRLGGGVMGGAFVLGVGWFNVSRTFVAAGPIGTLVHPSPLTPVFWVLVAGAFLGAWAFLSTYIKWVPWIGKLSAKELDRIELEESIEYALTRRTMDVDVQPWPRKGFRLIVFQLVLHNGRNAILECELVRASVTFEDIPNVEPRLGLVRSRVLPDRDITIHLPVVEVPGVGPFPGGDEHSGEIEVLVRYGHIKGGRRRLWHHRTEYQMAVSDDGFVHTRLLDITDDDVWEDLASSRADIEALLVNPGDGRLIS